MNTDVTVIGLGRMGAALAHALLAGGRSVCVWNRDAAKAVPLAEAGAVSAGSLAAAVQASPHVVVCVTDYAAWIDRLAELPAGALHGKTVIQLTNGAADEARALQALHAQHGASSLDGSILGFPSQVGTKHCPVTVSGDAAAFAAARDAIAPLGDVQYLGDDIAASSGLENALVFFSMGSFVCYLQAAALLAAAGLPRSMLDTRLKGAFGGIGWMVRTAEPALDSRNHQGTEATLETHLHFWQQVRAFAERSGASGGFLAAFEDLNRKAIAAGHGGHELSALHELLRPGAPNG